MSVVFFLATASRSSRAFSRHLTSQRMIGRVGLGIVIGISLLLNAQSIRAADSDSGTSVLTGIVTRIVDGDSIVVKSDDGVDQQVHLEGIDAPEVKQSSGDEATKALAGLIKGKKVEVKWKKKDDFQRILGQVYLESVHVNLKMIDKGLAWHFSRYYKSDDFADAEKKAKSRKLGLWSDSSPTPPWEFRKNNRDSEKAGLTENK